MARKSLRQRYPHQFLDGGIVVWKPRGPSSRRVVDIVQRRLSLRGLGHCGTLDPLASGVMVLTGGMGSKFQQWLTVHDKVYEATVWFGVGSESGDAEGPLSFSAESVSLPAQSDIEAILPQFIGEQMQVPPTHSAVRVDGQRAYKRARAGDMTPLKARPVRIEKLRILEWDGARCRIEVSCGPGTYIRSLAHDLGEALGVPATLMALRRTSCGVHSTEDALRVDRVTREHWWTLERLVSHLPAMAVSTDLALKMGQGQSVEVTAAEGSEVEVTEEAAGDEDAAGDENTAGDRVIYSDGKVQGIAVLDDSLLKPRRWLSRGQRDEISS